MSAIFTAFVICAAVGATVWARTEDVWITGQISAATMAVFVTLAAAGRILTRFSDPRRDEPTPGWELEPPSASWLVPGLGLGDGSNRHLDSRTTPALRALAADQLRRRHGIDLDDPADAPVARALLGERAWIVAMEPRTPSGNRRRGRPRRDATRRVAELLEGVENL